MEELESTVEQMPKNAEYWLLVGRYQPGVGAWFQGNMHRHKVDAEADASNYGYKECRLVRVLLPV